jgi:hypothetical protein
MTKTLSFLAKKTSSYSYAVREEGMLSECYFGDVSLCDAYGTSLWVFVPRDMYQDDLGGRVEANESLREVLADVRAAYSQMHADHQAEAAAEQWAENAWLRAAEYNAEHQDEMYREDMMGLT